MKRPVIGVIGNTRLIENRFTVQMCGETNLRAVAEVAGALPMMFAGCPDITDIGALLETVDGILLTGGRANVHPRRFGVEAHPKHEPYDERRDDLALALVEACVERGVPLFGICRGLQEMNVAYRRLAASGDPRTAGPGEPPHAATGNRRNRIRTTRWCSATAMTCVWCATACSRSCSASDTIRVNSLHGQGILDPGKRIVVEGVADDGTIEAIRIARRAGLCARRAVARRVRSAAQSDQPHAVSGVRRGGFGAQAGGVERRMIPIQAD